MGIVNIRVPRIRRESLISACCKKLRSFSAVQGTWILSFLNVPINHGSFFFLVETRVKSARNVDTVT